MENGFSKLQSERGRNRAEGKEIMGMEQILDSLLTARDDDRSRLDASSAHARPRQSPGLLEARQALARARDRCARERENLESEHGRWKDTARGWQKQMEAEAKWTRDLLATMTEEG